MAKTFAPLHELTKKNLKAAGNGQRRSFFYARVGSETLLYVGSAAEKKLDARKVEKHLSANDIDATLAGAKWMSGSLVKRTDGTKRVTFLKRKGTAEIDASEKKIAKLFKAIAISGTTVRVQAAGSGERERSPVATHIDTPSAFTSSLPGLPEPPAPGSAPPSGGPPSHPGGTSRAELAGRIAGELAPELLMTGLAGVEAYRELRSEDSSAVEKASAVTVAAASTVELAADSASIAVRLKRGAEEHATMRDAHRHAPHEGGHPSRGPSPDSVRDKVHALKESEKALRTLEKVSDIAGDVAAGAAIVYSGAKMVRAGKGLHDAATRKEALRDHIRHMKVIDALQKRFAGAEEPLDDVETRPVVRALLDRFSHSEAPSVGKEDVIDTLRLFVEIQNSSQKQSGVDLVANALKVAGGATALSGVGGAAGAALALSGAGLQLAKAGADKAVDHGRERKFQEQLALEDILGTADLSDEAQDTVAALVETEAALREARRTRTAAASALRDKRRELAVLREKVDADEAMAAEVDAILAGIDTEEDDLEELDIDAILAEADDDDDDNNDDDDDDSLDEALDDLLEAFDDDISLAVFQAEVEELQEALTDASDVVGMLREEHGALADEIQASVLPELFLAQQAQRLDDILAGKARREKVVDGKAVGFTERLRHETSVNEDASETALLERRETAVEVLMSGGIPPALRMDMIAMLGIDEEGWEKLQAADEETRRQALRVLMVV